jgi:hypothetical protein
VEDASELKIGPESRSELRRIQDALKDYRGFAGIEDRQASDRLICEYLTGLLEEFLTQLESLRGFLGIRRMNAPHAQTGRAIQRLEMMAEKVKAAPYAFSPFFTVDYVPDEAQEAIIHADFQTLECAERIENLMARTLGYQDDFDPLVKELSELVESLDNLVEERITAVMAYH